MTIRWRLAVAAVVALAAPCAAAADAAGQAQDSELSARVGDRLAQLSSSEWSVREAGFYELMDSSAIGKLGGQTWLTLDAIKDLFKQLPQREEQIKLALIGLLRVENARKASGQQLGEEFSAYHGDLLAAVSALRDRRALDVLMPNLASGNIATQGVAALGGAALDKLAVAIVDSSMPLRNAATRTLAQMLDASVGPPLAPRDVSRITELMLRASSDESPFVRSSAVQGLARSGSPEASARLRQLAGGDGYFVTDNGVTRYPVRDAATKALAAQSIR